MMKKFGITNVVQKYLMQRSWYEKIWRYEKKWIKKLFPINCSTKILHRCKKSELNSILWIKIESFYLDGEENDG